MMLKNLYLQIGFIPNYFFFSSHNSLFDEEFGNFQTSYSVNVSKPTEILDKLPHSNSLTTANNNNLLKLPIQKSAYNDVQVRNII